MGKDDIHDPSRSQIWPDSLPIQTQHGVQDSLRMHRANGSDRAPSFRMIVRQHAIHGLAVGEMTPSNRGARPLPLDPPFVCELTPDDVADAPLLNVLDFSVHARLIKSLDPPTLVADSSTRKLLLGDCGQCAFTTRGLSAHDRSLFIFSELSVRQAGSFRIRFDIINHSLSSFFAIGSVYSRPFVVHERSAYPGLSPSTDLILAIQDCGLKLRVIKDNRDRSKKSNGKQKARYQNDFLPHIAATHATDSRSEGEPSPVFSSATSDSSPSLPTVPNRPSWPCTTADRGLSALHAFQQPSNASTRELETWATRPRALTQPDWPNGRYSTRVDAAALKHRPLLPETRDFSKSPSQLEPGSRVSTLQPTSAHSDGLRARPHPHFTSMAPPDVWDAPSLRNHFMNPHSRASGAETSSMSGGPRLHEPTAVSLPPIRWILETADAGERGRSPPGMRSAESPVTWDAAELPSKRMRNNSGEETQLYGEVRRHQQPPKQLRQ
ncbi:unnamed protein product [Sympodiomycopsis kandeliae]